MIRKIYAGLAIASALGNTCSRTTLAQTALVPKTAPVSVLMLSDFHFDPFRDPAKVPELAARPVAEWQNILNKAPSADQASSYATLETVCKPRGEDTSSSLLDAALTGGVAHAVPARYVTVSGDLLVHQFECRYHETMKGKEGNLSAFAEKTISYVVGRVEQAFPSSSVYVALGNNDSGCGDYRMDVGDRFLSGTAGAVTSGWRGLPEADAHAARISYTHGGYYAIPPPGLAGVRLLVLNTTYLSARYTNCAGEKDGAAAEKQLAWMHTELERARGRGESVWILGHIPPGVDVYSTLRHLRTMCTAAPETFLATNALANTLQEYGDVVKLGIFGHTHTDEFRLLGNVPVKLVGSVTPINGNTPSFTVAQVHPTSHTLTDYTVFTASNTTGVSTQWTPEYSFRAAYGAKDFSGPSLRALVATFRSNPAGPASAEYQRDFFGGDGSPLPLVWDQYVCALDHAAPAAFHACLCPSPQP